MISLLRLEIPEISSLLKILSFLYLLANSSRKSVFRRCVCLEKAKLQEAWLFGKGYALRNFLIIDIENVPTVLCCT